MNIAARNILGFVIKAIITWLVIYKHLAIEFKTRFIFEQTRRNAILAACR